MFGVVVLGVAEGVCVAPGVGVIVVGAVLGLVVGIVLVVPAPTTPVPVVTPVVPVAPGVVPIVVLGVVLVGGHGVVPIVDEAVPLIVPVVPAVGLGVILGLVVVPAVLPVPPTVVAEPSVDPDPVLIPVEDVVHGLIVWVVWVDGDVVDVPMPVCDWVPTVCAANPIESVRIADVSHFVRILSS